MNEPKIRFKGFQGEWKYHTLSESDFCITAGGDVDKNRLLQSGKYPVVANALTNDGIVGYYADSFRIEGPAVTVTGRGEIGVAVARQYSFTPVVRLLSIKSSHDVGFLANAINCCKVAKESTGVPQLTTSKLQEYRIAIPDSGNEETNIASLFTTLDSQISAATSRLASLKQVKEASLQAMFPQEGETMPKVRFKGFEGEWKKVKLNSFAKRIMRKNSHLECNLALTIASAYGLVSQIDYFNNSVVGTNLRNYYLLKKGEFAYNKSYSNGYPFGSVKRLDRYEQGILSTLYIVFGIDDSISSDYLTHFFDTTLWHKEVAERAAEGARNHGLLNIGAEDFLDINIWKPKTKDEQQKIASYFTALDCKITLQSQRLKKLKQIKTACLDKMFV